MHENMRARWPDRALRAAPYACIAAAFSLAVPAAAALPVYDEAKNQILVSADPVAARAAAAPYIAKGANVPLASRAAALRVTAISYSVQGRYAEARNYFAQSYAAANRLHDLLHMAGALINIGSTWLLEGDYVRTIDSYRRGAALAEKGRHFGFYGKALANLSQAMATLGDTGNAMQLSREAERFFVRAELPVPPGLYVQRGSYELQRGRPREALGDLERARALLPPSDTMYTGDLLGYRSQALTRLGRFSEAQRALGQCLSIARTADMAPTRLLCAAADAELEVARQRPARARIAIERLMDIYRTNPMREVGALIFFRDLARLKGALARSEGDADEAARQTAMMVELDKKILNYRQKVELVVGTLEMERQGKDQSIDLLEARNANLVLRNQQQVTLWAGFIGALLAVLGGFFWLYRARQAQARREQRLDERARIARDLHDTLLQEMAGTQMALGAAASRAAAEGSPLASTLEGITRQISRTMVSARNSVWRIRDEAVDRGDLVGAVMAWLDQVHADQRDIIHLDVAASPKKMDAAKAEHLLRIIQEGVGNALRHGQPTRVDVTISEQGGVLGVSVADDGIGFAPRPTCSQTDPHWGLIGLGERAERLGASLNIKSAPGEGTVLLVTLPA